MRRLFVFGDSFTATPMHIWGRGDGLTTDIMLNDPSVRQWDKNNPQDYKEILAVKYKADILCDSPWTAVMGASEEWVQKLFLAAEPEITPDDVVLVVTTDPLREYLVPLVPTVGNIINLTDPGFVKQTLEKVPAQYHPQVLDQVKAAIQYFNAIATDDRKIQAIITTYYARIALYQKMLDRIGCRYLIVPGQADINYAKYFPRWDPQYNKHEELEWDVDKSGMIIHNNHLKVLGSLKRVSYNELVTWNDFESIMNGKDAWCGYDKRRNHLSKQNHKILADKLINSIDNNVDLDLTTDFEHSFITKANCHSADIIIDAEYFSTRL